MKNKYTAPTILVCEIAEKMNLLQDSGIFKEQSENTEQQVINPNDNNTVNGGGALGKYSFWDDTWE